MKKYKIYIVVILILMVSVFATLSIKHTKKVILDDVKLQEFNNNNRSFAIMISEDGNNYNECGSEICQNSSFPGVAYIYQKAECLDDKGATIDNALTFDSNTRQATVKSSKTLYCTLYFNKDGTAPTLTTFYINDQTQNKYTNTNTVTIHMAWSDADVKEYCITTKNDASDCVWKPTSNKQQIEESYTLTQSGLNTIYGFIRDNANNVSVEKNDSITYDTGAPIITSFYIKGNTGQPKYSNSVTRQEIATVTWNDNDVAYYCIIPTNNIADCDNNSNWKEASNNYGTITVTLNEGSNTYYAFLKDKAGNKSTIGASSSFDTIILDTIPPTITTNLTVASAVGQTSATITVVAEDTGSGVKQYCYSAPNVDSGYTCGNYSTNVTILLSGLQPETSYMYYIYAIDNADNSGTKVPVSFTTEKPANEKVIEQAGGQIQSAPVEGDTLRRFQGTNSTVKNNYICFGTSDLTECTKTSPDKYMYRIIGVDVNTNQLKVIKKEALDRAYYWFGSNSYHVLWNESVLFEGLNGVVPFWDGVTFLGNTTYIPDEYILGNSGTKWSDAISNHTWYYGRVPGDSYIGAELPAVENEGFSSGLERGSIVAKIGLMYLSDNALALGNDSECWYMGSGNRDCSSSWLNIKNNDPSDPGDGEEWTMVMGSSGYYFTLTSKSLTNEFFPATTASVRPVFYLIPNIKLDGTGDISDPYRIVGIS